MGTYEDKLTFCVDTQTPGKSSMTYKKHGTPDMPRESNQEITGNGDRHDALLRTYSQMSQVDLPVCSLNILIYTIHNHEQLAKHHG